MCSDEPCIKSLKAENTGAVQSGTRPGPSRGQLMSDDIGQEGQGVVLFLCMGQTPLSSLEYKLLDISELCLIPSNSDETK